MTTQEYRDGFTAGEQWAQSPALLLPTTGRPDEFVRGFADGYAEWMTLDAITSPAAPAAMAATSETIEGKTATTCHPG